MTCAPATKFSDDVTAVEAVGRGPLLLLLGSGLLWLVLAGILAAIGAIQAVRPEFLAGCPIFTYGHTRALAETAFVYGWLANAGLALGLWVLARLAGEPLRAPSWIIVGTGFWNLGVLAGLVGIASGDATALPLFELPRYVEPLLLAAYAAIAAGGILAWAGRKREVMFASHAYAVAALFLFPWIFSAAQVMLLWFPVRGVTQAVVASWFAQSAWSLWIAPLALAAAYYVVPKVTGKVLPSYRLTVVGFWFLIAVGPWLAGLRLIGGPVPAWIGTVATVSAFLLLFHYAVVALNLAPAWRAGCALRLIGAGLIAYILVGALDALLSLRAAAVATQFTYFTEAQHQLALTGAASLILFGALYFAVPRWAGRGWASSGLRCLHGILALLGTVLLVVGLAGAGLIQGRLLNDASVPFSAIAAETHPWLLAAAAGQILFLLGSLFLAFNFFATVSGLVCAAVGSLIGCEPASKSAAS